MAACVCRDEGRSPEERQTHAASVFLCESGAMVIVNWWDTLLPRKGSCSARQTYQRSSGEIIYEDETDSVAAIGCGMRSIQYGHGLQAGT